MPVMTILKESIPNFTNIIWFVGGFVVAVLVFKSKLADIAKGLDGMENKIEELDSRIDTTEKNFAVFSTSMLACQKGADEWRKDQKQEKVAIFSVLGKIQDNIESLIRKVG